MDDLTRDVTALSAPASVMIRESCTSLEQLGDIQTQITAEFGDSVASDLDLLEGRVQVFATSREIGNRISQIYGDLVHVEVGSGDCDLLPSSPCSGGE